MTGTFHQTYLSLVEDIERHYPVSEWRCDDVDIWPLARMDLYLELYWQANGTKPGSPARRYLRHITQAISECSRRKPKQVEAVFLGNGVSFERIGESWRDRFCEPVIAALEESGHSWLLLEGGDPHRKHPHFRPVYSTHAVDIAGHVGARSLNLRTELPAHDAVTAVLARSGIIAHSLSIDRLVRRARIVSSTASAFQRILRRLRPSLAFVVTWYAGLGPAFALACRRQRILSIDLQHCPQGRRHKAYSWWAQPPDGYSTMPAVFWNWTETEAAAINRWAGNLARPWHRGFHGGYLSLAGLDEPRSFASLAQPRREKEILIALQSLDGHQSKWRQLAEEIERSPPGWRWWIRRHPAARPEQDRQYASLLQLARPDVIVGPAADVPLPVLLPYMDAVVSLSSGTGVEASTYNVPALFLDREAEVRFADLFASGQALVVEYLSQLNDVLAGLAKAEPASHRSPPSVIAQSLECLADRALEYRKLFAPSDCGRDGIRRRSISSA